MEALKRAVESLGLFVLSIIMGIVIGLIAGGIMAIFLPLTFIEVLLIASVVVAGTILSYVLHRLTEEK